MGGNLQLEATEYRLSCDMNSTGVESVGFFRFQRTRYIFNLQIRIGLSKHKLCPAPFGSCGHGEDDPSRNVAIVDASSHACVAIIIAGARDTLAL